VDLTGLSEEEKAMIQSVMMRAQESDSSAKSQQPPTASQQFHQQQQQLQQGQMRPPVSQQQNRMDPVSNYQQQLPQQQQRPPQQVQAQPQMGQRMQTDVRQQMQPTAGQPVTMSQQANQFPQSGQQAAQNQRPQLQQQQPQTSQPQMQFMSQQQQQPQQKQQQAMAGMQSQPTSQYQPMSQSQDSRLPQNVPVSGNMREMPQQPQQTMSQTPASVMGFGVTHQMEEMGPKLDKQNFIETLQQQAQPIPLSPAVNPVTSVLPSSMNGLQSTSSSSGIVSQYPSSSSGSGVGTSMTPYASTSMYGNAIPSSMAASASAAAAATSTTSFAFSSSSSSLLSSSSSNAATAFTAPVTASPLISSYGQPLSSTSVSILDPASLQNHVFPAAQPPRRMVQHQQSWSEGTFENVLQQQQQQPLAGMNNNNIMTGVMAAGSGFPHQFNRRRSMEQMAGLPQDYGMNSVIEPFDFKMPVAAATTSVTSVKQSERMTDVSEKRITSPPREYSSVSDPPLVSSLSREIPVTTTAAASPETSPAAVVFVDPSPETHLTSPPQVTECPSAAPCPVPVDVPAAAPPLVTELPLVSEIEPVVVEEHVTVEPVPVIPEIISPPAAVVTSPTRVPVVAKSPPEAWVNPFSRLLKSFDDDAHDDVSAECPVSPPPVSSVSSHPPHVPECDPMSEAVQSPPATADAMFEKRASLTSTHSGSSRDHSPSRSSIQTKSSPTTVAGDMSPHRKSSGGDVTISSSKLDERRSSLGSNTSNFKTRTGALLPSIPIQGRVVQSLREDRVCLRTGSLGEQEFVQQLNSSVLTSTSSPTSSSGRPQQQQQFTNETMRDTLNFELDEEYENEGEQDEDDEDEDDERADVGADKYTCDTIVEESEEELLSPRSSVQNLMQNKKQFTPMSETSTFTPTVVTTGHSPTRMRDAGPRGSNFLSVGVCLVVVSLSSPVLSSLSNHMSNPCLKPQMSCCL
jgi:hypothetical protein